MAEHRVFGLAVAVVYDLYVTKLERKGHTEDELRVLITWLTGYSDSEIDAHLEQKTTFREFFAGASLNPLVSEIRGVICGVRVEDIEDPLMQQIRYLDKLVDELARGKKMQSVLRG